MATTQDLLRQRFAEASRERDDLLAKAAPLRQKRDALVAKLAADHAAKVDPLDAQIAAIEAPLAQLMGEIARISTVLNGQTAA